jgi:DNA-binding NtrC family response regulator
VATAVKAMQLGAENFLTKPVDLRHLAAAVARAAEKARLRRQVHEMRNALERAMIMAKGVSAIGDAHPPADLRRGASGLSRHRPQTLKEGERRQVERALEAHRGNRTWAARELGISRVTLLKKIKQYGLD